MSYNCYTRHTHSYTLVYNVCIIYEIEIEKINKKPPLWPYKLIDDLEQEEENSEESASNLGIRSRKAKHVVTYTDKDQNITKCTIKILIKFVIRVVYHY